MNKNDLDSLIDEYINRIWRTSNAVIDQCVVFDADKNICKCTSPWCIHIPNVRLYFYSHNNELPPVNTIAANECVNINTYYQHHQLIPLFDVLVNSNEVDPNCDIEKYRESVSALAAGHLGQLVHSISALESVN